MLARDGFSRNFRFAHCRGVARRPWLTLGTPLRGRSRRSYAAADRARAVQALFCDTQLYQSTAHQRRTRFLSGTAEEATRKNLLAMTSQCKTSKPRHSSRFAGEYKGKAHAGQEQQFLLGLRWPPSTILFGIQQQGDLTEPLRLR